MYHIVYTCLRPPCYNILCTVIKFIPVSDVTTCYVPKPNGFHLFNFEEGGRGGGRIDVMLYMDVIIHIDVALVSLLVTHTIG